MHSFVIGHHEILLLNRFSIQIIVRNALIKDPNYLIII